MCKCAAFNLKLSKFVFVALFTADYLDKVCSVSQKLED